MARSILFAYIAVAVGIEVRHHPCNCVHTTPLSRAWTPRLESAVRCATVSWIRGGSRPRAICRLGRCLCEQVWVHKNKEGGKDTESFFVAGRTLPWSAWS